ncbi:MAG: integrin alpha, partial [Bacteroidota bacterium]
MKSKPVLVLFYFSLVICSFFTSSNALLAQELADTRWRVLTQSNDLIGYFDFGLDDTLRFSADNIAFSNLGTYEENGTDLTILDYSGGDCGSIPLPGNYSFEILNNLLQFTLVDDPCASRALTFVVGTWIGLNSGGLGFASTINLNDLTEEDGIIINGVNPVDFAGGSVSTVGDFNNDGIDDVLIGATGVDIGQELSVGRSYLVYGTVAPPAILDLSTLDGTNGIFINGEAEFDVSGGSVSLAGDINGDNIPDLIIGANGADPGGNDGAGKSYVLFGGSNLSMNIDLSTLDGTNGFVINGIDDGDNSGVSVNQAGDLNDDGIDDVIIGANSAEPGGAFLAGESYVVFGALNFSASLDLSNLNGTNGFILNGIDAEDRSGRSVSPIGDFNDDGIDDILIGATGAAPNGSINAGECYVVFGANTFPTSLDLSSLNGSNGLT